MDDYNIKISLPPRLNEFTLQLAKDYFNPKNIKLKVYEVHNYSIVTKNFVIDKIFKPSKIIFHSKKHKKHTAKVVDIISTPEMTILYTDKDISKWSYYRGCTLVCEHAYLVYAAEELFKIINLGSRKT